MSSGNSEISSSQFKPDLTLSSAQSLTKPPLKKPQNIIQEKTGNNINPNLLLQLSGKNTKLKS